METPLMRKDVAVSKIQWVVEKCPPEEGRHGFPGSGPDN